MHSPVHGEKNKRQMDNETCMDEEGLAHQPHPPGSRSSHFVAAQVHEAHEVGGNPGHGKPADDDDDDDDDDDEPAESVEASLTYYWAVWVMASGRPRAVLALLATVVIGPCQGLTLYKMAPNDASLSSDRMIHVKSLSWPFRTRRTLPGRIPVPHDWETVQGSASLVARLRGGGDSQGLMDQFRAMSYERQNAMSVLVICVGIFGSVELQGKLRSRLPKSLSRKMTHIAVGSFLLLGMSMMPVGHSWTGKFVTCLVIYGFMMGFSFAAYIPDKDLQKLPSFLRMRMEMLIDLCRGGERIELMGGTFLYCVVVSLVVMLLGTSPLGIISLSALVLGDGFADPVGRALGQDPSLQYKLAWFGQKSYPGSIGCFLFTVAGSYLWGKLFLHAGHFTKDFDQAIYMRCAAICAAVATLGEATSPPMVDNCVIIVISVMAGFALSESGYAPFLTASNP